MGMLVELGDEWLGIGGYELGSLTVWPLSAHPLFPWDEGWGVLLDYSRRLGALAVQRAFPGSLADCFVALAMTDMLKQKGRHSAALFVDPYFDQLTRGSSSPEA